MDLLQDVGKITLRAIDEFENVLFQAATAESNGFSSIWSMYGKVVVVAVASGATVGSLSYLEEVVTKSNTHSDDILFAMIGGGMAAYGTTLYYREQMYKSFTGSGFIHVPLMVFGGCVSVPAIINTFNAKTGDRKRAFRSGTALGCLLYVFIGIIPVVIYESKKKSAALKTMKDLFEHCYPYDAAAPCSDKLKRFVQTFDNFMPDAIERLLNIKNNKPGMSQLMDRMMMMQNVNIVRALSQTPLGQLISMILRLKTTK